MPSTATFSAIRADLIRDEGYRERLYKDSRGILTIGVGHNLEASGLCRTAIFAQLDHDIQEKAVAPLDRTLPWWRNTPEVVQQVLIELCFNLGIAGLLKFKRTLAYVQELRYTEAAHELEHSQPWAAQVGKRANRLADLLRSVV